MRKFASLNGTGTLLCKVGTLPNVLLVTIKSLIAVSKDSEVAAYTMTSAHVYMRKETVWTSATTFVEKVKAKRSTFWRRVVGKIAVISAVWAIVLQKIPTYSDLGGVVLVHAGKAM
jgi:hypothetical protein